MMRQLFTLVSGLLFGIGLAVSGMVNPMKVLSFLDLAGSWDPTLILVMGAGVVVAAIGYRLIFARGRPFFDDHFHLPALTAIDARLVGGAAIFGLGWGMTGFCPGPAMASLVLGHVESFAFVLAMALGSLAARLLPEA
jgi:uncharacterized protein